MAKCGHRPNGMMRSTSENGLHDRAAQVTLEIGRAQAMPARLTGTEPVSECDAGVPAKPSIVTKPSRQNA
jgi:hypothetical protein